MTTSKKPHRRETYERFAKLPFPVLNTDAYLGLKPASRALLIQFAARIWAENNGKVYISVRDAAAMMGALDHHAASNAIRELVDHGFICEISKGSFKPSASVNGDCRASIWRATWIPVAGKEPATMDFQKWRATPKSQAAKRVAAGREVLLRWRISPATVVDSDTVSETEHVKLPWTYEDSTTDNVKYPIVSMRGIDEDSTTHVVSSTRTPFTRPAVAPLSLCKQARVQAISWLSNTGTRQCELAKLSGLSTSKLSRFLNRPNATLSREQLERIRKVMAPDYQYHTPKNSVAR